MHTNTTTIITTALITAPTETGPVRVTTIPDDVPATNRYRVAYIPDGRTWDEARAMRPADARTLLRTLAVLKISEVSVRLDEPATQHAQDEADQSYAEVTQARRFNIL